MFNPLLAFDKIYGTDCVCFIVFHESIVTYQMFTYLNRCWEDEAKQDATIVVVVFSVQFLVMQFVVCIFLLSFFVCFVVVLVAIYIFTK